MDFHVATILFLVSFSVCINVSVGQTILQAHISQNFVDGTVEFQQHNRTHVKVTIDFNNTFHDFATNIAKIHKYPVLYGKKCEGYGEELFDIATLAGEHLSSNLQFFTDKLTITGPLNSVLGSSFVISNTGGNITACAPILEKKSASKTSSYAVASISNSEIAGRIEFIQEGADGNTLIVGQISHSDGTNATDNSSLKWVVSDLKSENMALDCPTSMNNVFNPNGMSGTSCTSNQEDSCMIGDLSSKHGELEIGINGSKMMVGVDVKLPLSGEMSIINRFLVISQNTDKAKVLGCGVIRMKGPLEVQAEFMAVKNEGISGTVAFKQSSPYHGTEMNVDLQGLNRRTGGYHVHEYPIADPEKPSCSATSCGGHLNPYDISKASSPAPGRGTMDKYEIGDLSGKFGLMTGMDNYKLKRVDQNLPLFGYNSIIGRSVVIHNSTAGAPRLTCADISPKGGKIISGKLNFTEESVFNGFVEMRQYEQADGILTPTVFIVDTKYSNDSKLETENHNFHVHIRPVGNDTGSGVCSSVSNHYNPTDVNVKIEPSYRAQCRPDFPYRCELGDTSSKVGTYDVGKGKRLYVDMDTPMIGPYTVLGRSIVFHAPNKGTSRLACGDIVPQESGSMTKQYVFYGKKEVKDNDRMTTLKTILVNGLGLAGQEWKIDYLRLSEGDREGCYKSTFFIIGDDSSSYQSKFDKLMKKEEKTYRPCPAADSDNSSISLYTSALTLVISCLLATMLS